MTSNATHHPLLALATSALAIPFIALTTLQAPPAQATPLPASPAAAVWPLEPRPEVVRGFDLPAKPWLPGHRGLDLAGSPGQQVFAAASGTITYSGPLAGRGVIVITHGRLRTTYEPVIPTVRAGITVTPGALIAHLSAAGSHCPPRACLHWGLLNTDAYLNPLSLLPTRPVRLLPHSPPSHPAQRQPQLTRPQPQPPDRAQGRARPTLQPPNQPIPTPQPPAQSHAQPPPITQAPAAQTPASPAPAAHTPASPTPAAPTPGRTHTEPAPTQARASTDSTGQVVASAVVSLAAAATIGGSLLIRRH